MGKEMLNIIFLKKKTLWYILAFEPNVGYTCIQNTSGSYVIGHSFATYDECNSAGSTISNYYCVDAATNACNQIPAGQETCGYGDNNYGTKDGCEATLNYCLFNNECERTIDNECKDGSKPYYGLNSCEAQKN